KGNRELHATPFVREVTSQGLSERRTQPADKIGIGSAFAGCVRLARDAGAPLRTEDDSSRQQAVSGPEQVDERGLIPDLRYRDIGPLLHGGRHQLAEWRQVIRRRDLNAIERNNGRLLDLRIRIAKQGFL